MRRNLWILISIFMLFTFIVPIGAFFGFDPLGVRLGGTMPIGYLAVLLVISGTGLAIAFHQFKSASLIDQVIPEAPQS